MFLEIRARIQKFYELFIYPNQDPFFSIAATIQNDMKDLDIAKAKDFFTQVTRCPNYDPYFVNRDGNTILHLLAAKFNSRFPPLSVDHKNHLIEICEIFFAAGVDLAKS